MHLGLSVALKSFSAPCAGTFPVLEELELCGGGVGDAGARELGNLHAVHIL